MLRNTMLDYNLPMEDYLSSKNLGSSSLRKILLSPADFKASLSQTNNETTATALGTLVHTAFIEPHLLDKLYLFQTEDWGIKTKGEGKKKWDAFKKEAKENNKLHVEHKDYLFIQKLKDNIDKNPYIINLLKKSKGEVTAFCDYKGVPIKARADLLVPDDKMIWDVKTTSKGVDHSTLSRNIFDFGYHFQAAHQMMVFNENGVEVNKWGWIFLSTNTPEIHIVTKQASTKLLECATTDFEYAIELYNECQKSGNWWGFSNKEPDVIDLPDYVLKYYED